MYRGSRASRAMGGVLGMVAVLLGVQWDVARAQTPVPAFDRVGGAVRAVPATGRKDEETKTINIRHVRVVRGRIMLVGFDNRERPLPDGVYRTNDGKRLGVAGGRIRFVTLPAKMAARGKPVAPADTSGTGRVGGPPGASESSGRGRKPGGRRGRYRITINGFTVHQETRDDAFQWDGKRDEVYVTAQVVVVDKNRRVRRSAVVETKVMGDTNGHNGRIRAGSASREGGIRTGDDVPGPEPWRLRGTPRGDRLPLAVWQGELVEGENSVVVIPVLWEHDGVRSAYQGWRNVTGRMIEKIATKDVLRRILNARNKLLFDLAELRIQEYHELFIPQRILGDKMDRPIGLQMLTLNFPPAFVLDAIGRRGTIRLAFSPKALVINYSTAQRALKDNIGGKGRGVIAIRYKDHPDLEGDYTLYVQVQRL